MNESQGVGMFRALQLFFKNYVNFTGRSKRSEYWWMFLWNVILSIVLIGILVAIAAGAGMTLNSHHFRGPAVGFLIAFVVAVLVIGLAIIVPTVSLTVRRYRDAGISPWWLLLTMLVAQILQNSESLAKGSGMSSTLTWIGGVLTIANLVICAFKSKPEEA